MISRVLGQMDCPHDLIVPPGKLIWGKTLERMPFDQTLCRPLWRGQGNYGLTFTERTKCPTARKHIQVRYDAMKPDLEEGNDLFLPLLFHPRLLDHAHYLEAEELSGSTDRPIGILFAGNCDRETYDKARIRRNFGLMNRFEIYRAVMEAPGDSVWMPESRTTFETALAAGELRSKLVWIDTKRFRIDRSEWLSVLAKTRYFLCTPGVHYPFCHNLNEAMACGTVPILEYPHFYRPSLSDGLNCVGFSGAGELTSKICEIAAEDPADFWRGRSRAARDYHENNLSLTSLINRLEAFAADKESQRMIWHMAGK